MTECNQERFEFASTSGTRQIVAEVNGGTITSDAGGLLLPFGSAVGAIALDGNGGVFVAGPPIPEETRSCPTTPGCFQPSFAGEIVSFALDAWISIRVA